MSMTSMVIAAGGTGGHIFPALAVAACAKEKGVVVTWIGARGKMEERLVTGRYPLSLIDVAGLRGKGLMTLLAAPIGLARALWQAFSLLKKSKPSVVLAMGGFVAGPVGLAARLLRIPVVIHEQNAVAGMTNRLLSRVTPHVLSAYPNAFATESAVCVGNPLRRSIISVKKTLAEKRPISLLLLGGSLGARFINKNIAIPLARVLKDQNVAILHQTGERDCKAVTAMYKKQGVNATVVPFIDDMAAAYANADCVIARAGALTVSEIAMVGVASVLVPYPHAVDQHQLVNARFLEKSGASVVIEESAFNPDTFSAMMQSYCRDARQLAFMGNQAKALGRHDSAEKVLSACLCAVRGERYEG